MDEAGAWWNGVRNTYGEDAISRSVSCEFHYKQSVKRQSFKLPGTSGVRETFQTLALSMLEANTVSMFEKMANLNRFLKEKPKRTRYFETVD